MGRSNQPREAAAGFSAEPPDVSIVLVNFNGRHHLERCLTSVFATPEPRFEVIVVDNASTDGSVEWLRRAHPSVRVLAMGSNLGFGAGCHAGVEASRGGTIVFLNNDTEVEAGWLPALLEPLESGGDVAATCSVLRLLEHPEILNARGGGMSRLGFGYDRDFGFPYHPPEPGSDEKTVHDVIFPTAAAMAIRRAEFLECGGFDPSFFMYHEDVDLGWRLWLQGRRVVLCERSVVRHSYGGTTKAVRSLRWRERLGLRHNVRSLLKHYEFLHLLNALRGLVVLRVGHHGLGRVVNVAIWNLLKALQGLFAFRHSRRVLGLFFHIGWWNIVRLPGTLALRRRIQRRRRRSDAEIFGRGLIDFAPYPPPTPSCLAPSPRSTAAGSWFPRSSPARTRRWAGWDSAGIRESIAGASWFEPLAGTRSPTCGRPRGRGGG